MFHIRYPTMTRPYQDDAVWSTYTTYPEIKVVWSSQEVLLVLTPDSFKKLVIHSIKGGKIENCCEPEHQMP